MGKTRDLFKKIKDTKGTYDEKMGSTKGRNGIDLTGAEESEKVVLQLTIQKTKIMASGPITSWQIDGETVET